MPPILVIGYGDAAPQPPDLLTLTRQLYGRCPRSYELSITGADFGPGEGLSAAVAARPDDLLHRVREIIQR